MLKKILSRILTTIIAISLIILLFIWAESSDRNKSVPTESGEVIAEYC